jgi:LysR family hydrogen peroxide-inducible transcriptional activator
MVAGGAGITLLPRLSLEIETRRADLGVRVFSGKGPRRTLALVWRKHAPYARALGAIADTLRSVLVASSAPSASFGRASERSGRADG